MRVIAGKYRGKVLQSFEGRDIRPTIDRVKESIFNVIQFDVKDSIFVDLFAGTGSIGIEALSRGAKSVIFSDIAKSSLDIINANLKGIDGNYRVLNRDYRETLYSIKDQADFIFVDAPYKMDCIEEICEIADSKNCLKNNGYIIYEHDENKEFNLPTKFYIEKRKKFGIVVVDYIKKTDKICAVTGSFDPITLGHMCIIEHARKLFDKVVVVIAQNEEKKSFFTFDQRKQMVEESLEEYLNVSVEVCNGYVFEYLNKKNINVIVRGYRNNVDYEYEREMSAYNKEHGNIDTLLYQASEEESFISSTQVRNYLEKNEKIIGLVPKSIVKLVNKFYKEKNND